MYRTRELSAKDIPTINKWRQEELYSHLGGAFRYIDLAVDEIWYQNYLKNRHNTVRIVVVDKDDQPVAMGALTSIDHLNQKAEAHIMVGEIDQRGVGVGAFMGATLIKHAFMDLNLNKLEATVLADNKQALSMNKNGGFVEEGRLRKAVYKNGEFIDLILLGMLKEESEKALKVFEKFERRFKRHSEKKENDLVTH